MSVIARYVENGALQLVEGLPAIEALLERPGVAPWIDADERSSELERFLSERLKLHGLAIEDIFEDRSTPKIEDHQDFLYLVVHGVRREAQDPDALDTIELDMVIGPSWIFTHHNGPMRSVEGLAAELPRTPRVLERGPAFVAHALLDRLTDHYLPVIDRFEDEIDQLEEEVVERPRPELLGHLFSLKRSLQRLRKVAEYQRDLLHRLARGEFARIPSQARPYFRDVYDHFVRIADLAESYRELLTVSLDVYMSVQANRTNEIMKVLAIIATIMLPLTFVAGLYGMNFQHMPELAWRWGYPSALGLMASIALGLILYFRRRRWI